MDSADIWKKTIIQYYKCRPRELENICIAAQYKRKKKGEPQQNTDEFEMDRSGDKE